MIPQSESAVDVSSERRVLDKGFVRLIGSMGNDVLITDAARVSYASGTRSTSDDATLIRYMMRNRHTSPFEHVIFRFHVKAPIFVFRQWHRHRTWSYSEISGRYSVMKDEFYLPPAEEVRAQSKTNRQGSEGTINEADAREFRDGLEGHCEASHEKYEAALAAGVTREQARLLLPPNLYTEMYATSDLHNLLHFLALRCDHHAQLEIRVYAEAMLDLITPIVPEAVRAWNDYHPMRGGMILSRMEVEALRSIVGNLMDESGLIAVKSAAVSENKREQGEWLAKVKRLGFEVC